MVATLVIFFVGPALNTIWLFSDGISYKNFSPTFSTIVVTCSYGNTLVSNFSSDSFDLNELKSVLKEEGKTQIKLVIIDKNKSFSFKLEKTRKFDLNIFNSVKNKQYVRKISF